MTAVATNSTALVVQADQEPTIRRYFTYVDPAGNSNKWWKIEAWQQGKRDLYRVKVTYARMGEECAKPYWYDWTLGQIEAKVAEKKRPDRHRGSYQERQLHVPTAAPAVSATTTALHPKVQQVVDLIFREAGEAIDQFLKVKVDALGQADITEGRRILGRISGMVTGVLKAETARIVAAEAPVRRDKAAIQQILYGASRQWRDLYDEMVRFYTVIPTKLPRLITPGQLVSEFIADITGQREVIVNGQAQKQAGSELADRLDQLEAALSMYTVQNANTGSQYDALGATITLLDPQEARYAALKQQFTTTNAWYNARLRKMELLDIFEVCIPGERARYEACKRGGSNIKLRWHGTSTKNVRHILKSGLRIPGAYTNGWAFGPGVYLALQSQKSQQYCHTTSYSQPIKLMFGVEAKLGNMYKPRRSDWSMTVPHGYDSTWADPKVVSSLENDEFIVPDAAQCTIRYLISFTEK
jgi:hypothetical protein